MLRIFIPFSHIKDQLLQITGENARYLTSVLRCKKGDELIVFDGKGNCLMTKIQKADKRKVTTEVLEEYICNTESHLFISLVQGLLKGQKMDIVVQKATELGVKEILPIITARSQLRETKKIIRWRKIAEEASKQSGRIIVPSIHDPMEFSYFFAEQRHLREKSKSIKLSNDEMNGLIFWEEGGLSLKEAMLKISSMPIQQFRQAPFYVLIGPEGGFTKEEVSFAKENGIMVISLGRRILRAETAAIAAVTLIQYVLGDLS